MKIFNTLSRRKEEFTPITPGVVNMFVCGPTVYDLSHIGHAKTYTQFDFVAKYLKKRGYKVTYAQNITDVDDKIINRAAERGVEAAELATQSAKLYIEDIQALGNTSVDVYAPAHDFISEIVSQVQVLINKGHAYQLDDGWYYNLTTFKGYGKLSGRIDVKPEDSLSRVDENVGKRNTGDCALWKARKDGEPYWDTVLGSGRPGWHIEDTAVTEALFGPQYDLHGGAADLMFPHHEAEIAQMEAASGKEPLVRCWMHTGLLRTDGDKMSKSLGNFVTIRDALKTTDYRTLRYAFISHHYRSSMEFTESTLEHSKGARRRVENFARLIGPNTKDTPETEALSKKAFDGIVERLDDDFDTPGALAVLFDYIRDHNRSELSPGPAARQLLNEINDLFGSFDLSTHSYADSDIEEQLALRRQLRAERRFAEADEIRDVLSANNIVIEDTSDGTRWWIEESK